MSASVLTCSSPVPFLLQVLPPSTTGSSWPSLTLGASSTPGLVWSPKASGHWMLTWTKCTALTT